jgi:UDP-glucose 4-epimerase
MSKAPSRVVAVLGSSGFVGGAVVRDLRARGVHVRPVNAPRLWWSPDLGKLDMIAADLNGSVVEALAGQLDGAQVVVHAAGLPDGTATASKALYGANALLPVLVGRACALAGVERFVHVSSAACRVHGRWTRRRIPSRSHPIRVRRRRASDCCCGSRQ